MIKENLIKFDLPWYRCLLGWGCDKDENKRSFLDKVVINDESETELGMISLNRTAETSPTRNLNAQLI